MKNRKILLGMALIGFGDSAFLTYEHYNRGLTPCSQGIMSSCNEVLTSSYSEIFGIPLALLGLVHYSLLTILTYKFIKEQKDIYGMGVVFFSYIGLFVSIYLVSLMTVVLNAYCIYCMLSALTSLFTFVLVCKNFYKYRKQFHIRLIGFAYRKLLKPVLFKLNPETVHESIVAFGEVVGRFQPLKLLLDLLVRYENKALEQDIEEIYFPNPIGLAAGFDYDAKLTQVLDALGFGFQAVGTVTNMKYEGNPRPRLGRLPKSKSLMVNKGFKSEGADKIVKKLKGKNFAIPVGISIGRTNSTKLKTQKQSVKDIITAFNKLESADINNAYYELNISCPNLFGDITFYPSKNLDELLSAVDKLDVKKPIFIKMPIDKSDNDVLRMLKIISQHDIEGVIFGNLQKDRKHKSLNMVEVNKFQKGNFSGRPTFERSNELISLAYKHYKDRFVIIGCGGVFNAEDAVEKIKRGASLVQLITGMIFEGPQVISNINMDITKILENQGYANVSEIVGEYHKKDSSLNSR